MGGYPTRSGANIREQYQSDSPTQVDEIKVDIVEETPKLLTKTPFTSGTSQGPVMMTPSSSLKSRLTSGPEIQNEIKIFRSEEEKKIKSGSLQTDNRRSFVSTTSTSPSISSNGQIMAPPSTTPPTKPKQKIINQTQKVSSDKKITIQQRTPVKREGSSTPGTAPVATVSFDLSMSKSFRSPSSGKKMK